MFAKADPRSIRYNSQIGVVNLANPPMPFNSAGVIGSIWPSPYATPGPMTPSAFPVPTPAGSPNPAAYSQLGDNGPAGSNPYSEAAPANETDFTHNDPVRPVMMNRPFRSVGEMAYAFRDQPFRTLSFSLSNSPDAGLLDLFSANHYSDPSGMRGGVVNLNSHQAPALAEINLAGRAHAFDVSAVRREIEVSFKNFVLRVVPLEFERAGNLNELSAECSGGQMITQPRELHRNGRGPAVRAARPKIKGRTHQCDRVNSRVMPIIFVFKSECRIDQRGRNIWQRSPDSKFLIGGQSDAKQFPVAIANTLGK
jgi:hypothetical protein